MTLVFLYDDISSDKLELIKKWQNKYLTSRFLAIIPRMDTTEKLTDGHPNKLGHETIAKNIYEYLNSEQIVCHK